MQKNNVLFFATSFYVHVSTLRCLFFVSFLGFNARVSFLISAFFFPPFSKNKIRIFAASLSFRRKFQIQVEYEHRNNCWHFKSFQFPQQHFLVISALLFAFLNCFSRAASLAFLQPNIWRVDVNWYFRRTWGYFRRSWGLMGQ